MKVNFHIPQNGYKADIKTANETGNYPEWVDAKFGARIREVISDDFTLTVDGTGFIADFTFEDDGVAFIKIFGGRQIG